VKHWFGVLVINVFGDWVGDVNDKSGAGVEPSLTSSQNASGQGVVMAAAPQVGVAGLFLGSTNTVAGDVSNSNAASTSSTVSGGSGKVLTAAAQQQAAQKVAGAAQGKDMGILFALSAMVMLVAGAMLSIDRRLKRR
jgi:hypothetical protein